MSRKSEGDYKKVFLYNWQVFSSQYTIVMCLAKMMVNLHGQPNLSGITNVCLREYFQKGEEPEFGLESWTGKNEESEQNTSTHQWPQTQFAQAAASMMSLPRWTVPSNCGAKQTISSVICFCQAFVNAMRKVIQHITEYSCSFKSWPSIYMRFL